MLISNKIVWFNQSIVIVFLVFILYAQNVLTYNDQIDQNTIDRTNQNASKRVPYDSIYYMEHNVSQGDAKQSFFDIGIKLIDGSYYFKKSFYIRKKKFLKKVVF